MMPSDVVLVAHAPGDSEAEACHDSGADGIFHLPISRFIFHSAQRLDQAVASSSGPNSRIAVVEMTSEPSVWSMPRASL